MSNPGGGAGVRSFCIFRERGVPARRDGAGSGLEARAPIIAAAADETTAPIRASGCILFL